MLVQSQSDKRSDNSLGLLAKRFMNELRQSEEGVVDLNETASTLQVAKRRLYDITNVMEGIGTLVKVGKNSVKFK